MICPHAKQIRFRVLDVDTSGVSSDTGKEIVWTMDKVRTIIKEAPKDLRLHCETYGDYLSETDNDFRTWHAAIVLLWELFGFNGKFVPGYRTRWENTTTKDKLLITYNNITTWALIPKW